jgi:hypothetical protein
MQVEGITWHGLTLEPEPFAAMKKLCREVFGLTPMMEQDGWTLFSMPNGTMLDLFKPNSELIPSYGLNDASCSVSGSTTSTRPPPGCGRRAVSSCATFSAYLR